MCGITSNYMYTFPEQSIVRIWLTTSLHTTLLLEWCWQLLEVCDVCDNEQNQSQEGIQSSVLEKATSSIPELNCTYSPSLFRSWSWWASQTGWEALFLSALLLWGLPSYPNRVSLHWQRDESSGWHHALCSHFDCCWGVCIQLSSYLVFLGVDSACVLSVSVVHSAVVWNCMKIKQSSTPWFEPQRGKKSFTTLNGTPARDH